MINAQISSKELAVKLAAQLLTKLNSPIKNDKGLTKIEEIQAGLQLEAGVQAKRLFLEAAAQEYRAKVSKVEDVALLLPGKIEQYIINKVKSNIEDHNVNPRQYVESTRAIQSKMSDIEEADKFLNELGLDILGAIEYLQLVKGNCKKSKNKKLYLQSMVPAMIARYDEEMLRVDEAFTDNSYLCGASRYKETDDTIQDMFQAVKEAIEGMAKLTVDTNAAIDQYFAGRIQSIHIYYEKTEAIRSSIENEWLDLGLEMYIGAKEIEKMHKVADTLRAIKYIDDIFGSYHDSNPKTTDSPSAKRGSIYDSIKLKESGWKKHITEITEDLVAAKFIMPGTKHTTVQNIFTGKKFNTPVRWIGDDNALTYFLQEILDKAAIEDKGLTWNIAAACFEDSKGNRYNEDIRKRKTHKLSGEIKKALDKCVSYLTLKAEK